MTHIQMTDGNSSDLGPIEELATKNLQTKNLQTKNLQTKNFRQ
jgi:hypothetical protein